MEDWEYSDYYCPKCGEQLMMKDCENCGGESSDPLDIECDSCGNLGNIFTCESCEATDEELIEAVKEQKRNRR